MTILLGLVLSAVACAALYLSSPNQRLIATPWPRLLGRVTSVVAIVACWFVWRQAMSAVTAAFVLVTAVMLFAAACPYVGAWRSGRRKAGA